MGNSTIQKNILMVDDDPSITKMLSMVLKSRGYQVQISNTATEAYESINETIDVVLLDLSLPDAEGFQVCRRFKEDPALYHIPIIILSGRIFSKDITQGLYMGADDYLTKPFAHEELIARIEAVTRRSSIFSPQNHDELKRKELIISELRTIIDQKMVIPFYQPIYDIQKKEILGFEILSRPEKGLFLSNPEMLFKSATQYGFYQELEKLAWTKGLDQISEHITDYKVFLNCNPYLIQALDERTFKLFLDSLNVKPHQVVLEITERSAITDYDLFYKNLQSYRKHGFKFAVDDVGGGYASLETIVQVKPETVKIDRHIVQGLHKDPYRESIVKSILVFCNDNGILSIAEGIEDQADLVVLRELGVHAAQGYFLCEPRPSVDLDEMKISMFSL